MRSILASIQEKINKANQTIYENANPKMRVQVRRAKTTLTDTDLFYVETIREKTGLGDISLALYRPNPDKAPTFVYDIHNDNGTIKTTLRDLSQFQINYKESIWKHQFDVGPGKVCSIEFNGYWTMDSELRYNLITEEKPWIFWTNAADVLYAQKWDNINSKFTLSTGVIKVSSIRAWKNVAVIEMDQGLICAYIKNNGKAYYRNYSQQADLTTIWEYEKELTQFAAPVESLALFRTNDYRVGFMAEINGAISWSLTYRAWAGMAIKSEHIESQIMMPKIAIVPVNYRDTFIESCNITSEFTDLEIQFCPASFDIDDVVIISSMRLNANQLQIVFSHTLIFSKDITNLFEVENYTVTLAECVGDTVTITVVENISSFLVSTVNYTEGILRVVVAPNCNPLLPSFTREVAGDPPEHNVYINANVEFVTVQITTINYSSTEGNAEHLNGSINMPTILVTKIGVNPL